MTNNPIQLKEKIMSRIRLRGPSLPIHVAKDIGTDTLFGSAFLSELVSEKKLKISNLKVGNSPLYYIKGQESLLEKFSQYLNNKEREAYELLKEKRILKDSKQHPAIRVALREIKDFAFLFKKDDELFWRYLTVSEREIIENQERLFPKKEIKEIPKDIEKQTNETLEEIKPKKTENEKKPREKIEKPKKEIKKVNKKKTPKKKDSKFFNKVKEYLTKRNVEIIDIENFNKEDLILRVKKDEKEKLLIAFNKKRIREEDIIKAYKKASEADLEYTILSLGEPLRKLSNFIQALQKLDEISKIE